MLGFAIVDRQPSTHQTAVWLTTHVGGSSVQHTNAVVIAHDDERYDEKVRALTADRVVVLTAGTKAGKLFRHAVGVGSLAELVNETATRQRAVEEAVTAYAARTKNKNLVVPDFPSAPKPPAGKPAESHQRALAVATYVAAVWSGWLVTEEQRLRRTTDPRTGKSPWIMPAELADPELAEFPPALEKRLRPEPLS